MTEAIRIRIDSSASENLTPLDQVPSGFRETVNKLFDKPLPDNHGI